MTFCVNIILEKQKLKLKIVKDLKESSQTLTLEKIILNKYHLASKNSQVILCYKDFNTELLLKTHLIYYS